MTLSHRRSGDAPPLTPPVAPLTKTDANGAPYTRPPEIETQLMELLPLPRTSLLARAAIADAGDAAYVRDECLVYFLHECHKRRMDALFTDLSRLLLTRIERTIRAKMGQLGPGLRDLAYEAVVASLFDKIADPGSRGDFLQVRFGKALLSTCIDVRVAHVRERKRDDAALHLDAEADTEEGTTPAAVPDTRVISGTLAPDMRDFVARLAPEKRDTLIWRSLGYPIDGNDRPTIVDRIAERYGRRVTERTVRNWLREIERQWSREQGGEQ